MPKKYAVIDKEIACFEVVKELEGDETKNEFFSMLVQTKGREKEKDLIDSIFYGEKEGKKSEKPDRRINKIFTEYLTHYMRYKKLPVKYEDVETNLCEFFREKKKIIRMLLGSRILRLIIVAVCAVIGSLIFQSLILLKINEKFEVSQQYNDDFLLLLEHA